MFERLFSVEIDEKTLIEKAKTDHRDFARLYDRFVHVVYRFVRRHVQTEQDAEDIVSETFMAVATKIISYDTSREQKFTSWLLAIAKYKLADHRRAVYNKSEESFDESYDPAYETDMAWMLTNTVLYEKIFAFVQTLSKRQGSIFFLRYIEELSNKEIATLYDIDERTVSSTLSIVAWKIKNHCQIE